MTYDDINRWEAEINSWRQRYNALVKAVADSKSITPPPMTWTDMKAFELGFSHGVAAEREALASMFDGAVWSYDYREIAAAIRARKFGHLPYK